MFKKERIKEIVIPGIILIISAIIGFLIISEVYDKKYEKIINETISKIVDEIRTEYPNISEENIVKILQDADNKDYDKESIKILKKYGYNTDESYIKKLEQEKEKARKIDILFIIAFGTVILCLVIIYNNRKEKKIREINDYLNEVNRGKYELRIEENEEDELSKLRNELYKTTILLREAAENSEKEKLSLSNSLADISHQIKTPLTSIRIMLDNIEENPEMDSNTKAEFIKEISKQVDWISSLIVSLLKLAKFDAGAIVMNNTDVNVKELVNNVIANLAIILDIKNMDVITNIDENATIKADYNWQLEAITNIVKNGIEHSKDNSKIYIDVENNSLFVKIKIRDEGEGISQKDIKHIFNRFYKSENSSENSIGIGLSLAKTIIEKENGYITVSSKVREGTTFEIKYLKN